MQGPAQPFGGSKWSGIGVENGPWGLASFYELQTLYRARR
jgi:acyl-CoA reductase-like NAD-dependent aldehyde dehydrogenase